MIKKATDYWALQNLDHLKKYENKLKYRPIEIELDEKLNLPEIVQAESDPLALLSSDEEFSINTGTLNSTVHKSAKKSDV